MTSTQPQSLWLATGEAVSYPALDGDLDVDVAVIGGGIAGLTTALLLKRGGRSVAVLEADRVAGGASGNNTAKVTALQQTVYSDIAGKHGADVAATYATASRAAVETVAQLAEQEDIDCDLGRYPAYTFAMSAGEVTVVLEEARAASAAGLPVTTTADVPIPLPVHGAVRLDDQIRLHPVRYLRGLAAAIDGDGCRVFEGTRASRVHQGSPCLVHTGRGVIRAAHVVVATHYPMLDRGLYFARLEAVRSYCIAAEVPDGPPQVLAINAGRPTRSVAFYDGLLVLGGEGHPAGSSEASPERFDRLAEDARQHFGATAITHRWSAQDPVSYDRLPVIGSYTPVSDSLLVASGFRKWGLTSGTFAATILTNQVLGRPNPWAAAFRPHRISLRSLPKLAQLGAKVTVDLVGDRLKPGEVSGPAEVAVGEGRILRRGTRRSGVYRDETGHLHAVSLRCTHLGCLLRFNSAEHSWDCPCHGSRFAVDGGVLEGPAVRPLDTVDLSDDGRPPQM